VYNVKRWDVMHLAATFHESLHTDWPLSACAAILLAWGCQHNSVKGKLLNVPSLYNLPARVSEQHRQPLPGISLGIMLTL